MTLLDRLVTGDPLLERLRLAARGTAAVVLAGAALLALVAVHRLPGMAAALGTLIALWVTIQANDQQRRARMVTAGLLPFVAAATVALAAFLSTLGPAGAPVAFVAVAFIGVWARRFGPRGFALGMMAIFGMFFTLFLRPSGQRFAGSGRSDCARWRLRLCPALFRAAR